METKDLSQFQAIKWGWLKALASIWLISQPFVLAFTTFFILRSKSNGFFDLPYWHASWMAAFLASIFLFTEVITLPKFLEAYWLRNVRGYCVGYYLSNEKKITHIVVTRKEETQRRGGEWYLRVWLGGWWTSSEVGYHNTAKIKLLRVDRKSIFLLYTDPSGGYMTIEAEDLSRSIQRQFFDVDRMTELLHAFDNDCNLLRQELVKTREERKTHLLLIGRAAAAMWESRQIGKSIKIRKAREKLTEQLIEYPDVVRELIEEGYELPPIPGQAKAKTAA